MKTLYRLVIFLFIAWVSAAQAAEPVVPTDLKGWEPWVLHGEDFRRCPFVFAQNPANADAFRCAWPGRLRIDVNARGGNFTQSWQVYAESWIRLPGSLEHWPRNVSLNGAPAALVERGGVPMLRLGVGAATVSGRFEWSARPETLPIATQTAWVELTVDGQRVAQPDRPNNDLALGKRDSSEQPAGLEVQVYRLLSDDIPARLETRLRLQVAGDGREEVLARALPDGFTPLALNGDLPARLDSDGRLRVQLRPGSHMLVLLARGADVASKLTRPKAGPGVWPRVEIWSFAGSDRLRVAAASGPEAIDPAQADVPPDWRSLPAFRMASDSELSITETQRGLSQADENRLQLTRRLWLDFDRRGFTALDSISGTLRQGWRLDMQAPYRLESARSGAQNLLVTESTENGGRGVELRAPALDLQTLARAAPAGGALPATGWQSRFESVRGELYLPPGHRLLAAVGPDNAGGTWWSGWGLWSLFVLVLVPLFTYRLAGALPAALALGALILSYQEWPALTWFWANLLIAMALAMVVPDGRLRRWVLRYRALAVGLLVLALLPFVWGQIRYTLHPQLATDGLFAANMGGGAMDAEVRRARAQPMPEGAMVEEAALDAPAEVVAGAADTMNAAVEPASEIAVAASPAPPPMPEPVGRPKTNVSYGGLNSAQVVQRYAPGTAVQTGPGIPAWSYGRYAYSWSGPVESADSVRFIVIGPFLLGLWRLLSVGLLLAWLYFLLKRSYGFELRMPTPRAGDGPGASPGASLASLSLVALLTLGSSAPLAAGFPDANLLNQLGERLRQPPPCVPQCASIVAAKVNVANDRMQIELDINTLANVAVPVPHASDRWQLDEVSVDGAAGATVLREGDGSHWLPLRSGAHRVRLGGRLAQVANVQVSFPSPPRAVSVEALGWDVTGLNEGRLLSSALELTRKRSAASLQPGAMEQGAEFPAFVRVVRDFNLDLDWSVTTTVERVAPERAAINVAIPLVPGESVLTPGVEVRGDQTVLAGIDAGAMATTWTSGLPRSDALELKIAAGAPRNETWRFVVNPQWHAEFNGLPATLPDDLNAPNWVYTYFPRNNESLTVRLTRPKAAEGATLAIDRVEHTVRLGTRTADAQLQFAYRSTLGGRHTIKLPPDATVQAVAIDGQPAQLRPENGELSIGLLPGEHQVDVSWRAPRGVSLFTASDAVDLRSPASNVTTKIELPADRWALAMFARGAGVGPAVLYWGELIVFLLTAWLLGRWAASPLRTHEWLLLGLGVSTLSWGLFVLAAAWLFALKWREQWPAQTVNWRFNSVQVLLAALTVVTVAALFTIGIKDGFFSTPNMGVIGPGAYDSGFTWFRDRADGALPQPAVLSVPLLIYRGLILAWALWLALALIRWLTWAWRCWTQGGYWRSQGDKK